MMRLEVVSNKLVVVGERPAHGIGYVAPEPVIDFAYVENWMMKNDFRPVPCGAEDDGIFLWIWEHERNCNAWIQVAMAQKAQNPHYVRATMIDCERNGLRLENREFSFEACLKFLKRHTVGD